MATKAFSEKVLDPKSKAVRWQDDFIVCKWINGAWHIVEGALTEWGAKRARTILAVHDVHHGHATNEDWKVFPRKELEIVEAMEAAA